MIDPANRLVRECIELADQKPEELARVLETYDAADAAEQRRHFETMLKVALGAMVKLSLGDPEVLDALRERRNRK